VTTVAPAPPAPVVPLAPYDRRTLNQIFFEAIDRFGPGEALRYKRDSKWQSLTYREVELRVAHTAQLLRDLGLAHGDRVAILSENRPEWAFADYAALALGLIVVPIYPTLPPDQVDFILRDAGARLVFTSTAAQLQKIRAIRERQPTLEHVVVFDRSAAGEGVESLERLLDDAANSDGQWIRELRKKAYGIAAESVATIIYTSGTTGTPKGVMLSHQNLAAMVAASRQHGSLATRPGMVALSLLPLSHVLERGATTTTGITASPSPTQNRLRRSRPICWKSVPRS